MTFLPWMKLRLYRAWKNLVWMNQDLNKAANSKLCFVSHLTPWSFFQGKMGQSICADCMQAWTPFVVKALWWVSNGLGNTVQRDANFTDRYAESPATRNHRCRLMTSLPGEVTQMRASLYAPCQSALRLWISLSSLPKIGQLMVLCMCILLHQKSCWTVPSGMSRSASSNLTTEPSTPKAKPHRW